MTTKDKIALINKAIDHLFCLSSAGVLSDDELLYLYNEFKHLRQNLRELRREDEKGFQGGLKYGKQKDDED